MAIAPNPTMNETAAPIAKFVGDVDSGSRSFSIENASYTPAPASAGIASKNENVAADRRERPRGNAAEIVEPLREECQFERGCSLFQCALRRGEAAPVRGRQTLIA